MGFSLTKTTHLGVPPWLWKHIWIWTVWYDILWGFPKICVPQTIGFPIDNQWRYPKSSHSNRYFLLGQTWWLASLAGFSQPDSPVSPLRWLNPIEYWTLASLGLFKQGYPPNPLVRKIMFHISKRALGVQWSDPYISKSLSSLNLRSKDDQPKKMEILKFHRTLWRSASRFFKR